MNINEYHIQYEKKRLWEKTTWLGVPCWKYPADIVVMQELICKVRPDFIIETGTAYGGSALFYASILELLGHGQVMTIDTEDYITKRMWPLTELPNLFGERVRYIQGNSIDYVIFEDVERTLRMCRAKKTMVILDSDHKKDHVLKEMNLYGSLVSVGSYMIVEDTHMNGHPVPWEHGDGPWEAVEEYLKVHDEFVVDKKCERHGLTFNPNGYLKRIK